MGNTATHHDLRSALIARAAHDEGAALALQAASMLDDNISNPPTLQAMASELYVSRTRLCSTFKRETGLSLGKYLNLARIEHAQNLLASSSLSIAEIATAVGYTRQSSFTERFKEEVGITPTEWRRNVRG